MIPEIPLLSKEKQQQNITAKSKIALAREQATDERARKVLDKLQVFLALYGVLVIKPEVLKSDKACNDPAGLYLISHKAKPTSGFDLKDGMSQWCHTRVNRQGPVFVAKAMDLCKIRELVPSKFVQQVVALDLPGLNFHPDMN